MQELVNSHEAGLILGLSVSKVKEFVKKGHLTNLGNSTRYWYNKSEVEKLRDELEYRKKIAWKPIYKGGVEY